MTKCIRTRIVKPSVSMRHAPTPIVGIMLTLWFSVLGARTLAIDVSYHDLVEPKCETVDKFDESVKPVLASVVADYRRPVDMLLVSSGRQIAVACSGNGEVCIVDWQLSQVTQRIPVASSVDDLIEIVPDQLFVAVSTRSNSISLLRRVSSKAWEVVEKKIVGYSPVKGIWDSKRAVVIVSCLWEKRLHFIPIGFGGASAPERNRDGVGTPIVTAGCCFQNEQHVDVELWPHCLEISGDGDSLIVTNRYGPSMMIFDLKSMSPLRTFDWFGAPVLSMAIVPDRNRKEIVRSDHGRGEESLIANEPRSSGVQGEGECLAAVYSLLNQRSATNENDIHWGVLINNDLQIVPLERMKHFAAEYRIGEVHPVGIPGNGAAEPTCVAFHPETRQLAVTIGGTNQVAMGHLDRFRYEYRDVGKFPTAALWSAKGDLLFIANQFDDSIDVIDSKMGEIVMRIELGPLRSLTQAEMGEQFFHSAALSHDRWLTCASCHIDGHTNGLLADNFADHSFGAPKRVLSLLGCAETEPFTWRGFERTLETQTEASIYKTMNGRPSLDRDTILSIVAYVSSLAPPKSIRSVRSTEQPTLQIRGERLFREKGCVQCHAGTSYTSTGVYDVGLPDEKGERRFNPPSLRGVSQRGEWLFHDNRAVGLRGVIADWQHQLDVELSEEDLEALLVFLESI